MITFYKDTLLNSRPLFWESIASSFWFFVVFFLLILLECRDPLLAEDTRSYGRYGSAFSFVEINKEPPAEAVFARLFPLAEHFPRETATTTCR